MHKSANTVDLIGTQLQEDSCHLADLHRIDQSDALIICGEVGSLSDAAEYAREQGISISYCPIM